MVLLLQITSLRERLAAAAEVDQGASLPLSQQGIDSEEGEGKSDLEKLGYNVYSGSSKQRPGSSLEPQSSPALNSQLSVQSEMFRGGEERGRMASGSHWGGKLGRLVKRQANTL